LLTKSLSIFIFWAVQASAVLIFFVPFTWGLLALWAVSHFSRAVGFLSNVFMIGVGGYYMLYDRSFTPGDVVLFRAYWWRLFGPVQTLARVNDMVQRASAAAKRIFEVLDAPDELPDAPDAVPLTQVTGAMELHNVSFAYDTYAREEKKEAPENRGIAAGGGPGHARAGSAHGAASAGSQRNAGDGCWPQGASRAQ